jgi:response regulator RpfG family c-di-GMP phosphodiesterase
MIAGDFRDTVRGRFIERDMEFGEALDLGRHAFMTALMTAAPILVIGLVRRPDHLLLSGGHPACRSKR